MSNIPLYVESSLKHRLETRFRLGFDFRNAWNPKQPFLSGSMFGETTIKQWYVVWGSRNVFFVISVSCLFLFSDQQ